MTYYTLSSLLLGASAQTRREVVETRRPIVVMTYRAFGISCDHCKHTIEAALVKVDGVRLVEVDVDTKTIRVAGDADHGDVRAAIVASGYEIAEITTT